MQRLAWKEGLIAKIEARVHAPPVPLAEIEKGSKDGIEYARVSVRGTFRHNAEQFVWAPEPGQGPGYHVYTPLQLEDGRFILVNRGYVTEALRPQSARAGGQVGGEVEVVGLLREPPRRSLFNPDHDSKTGVWFWRDFEGMSRAALGADAGKAVHLFLDAETEPANPGGWPQGGTTRLTLPNRHLEYALTWYGLAAALVAVLIAFMISRARPS
jgi:surfeit locus 1 family protein